MSTIKGKTWKSVLEVMNKVQSGVDYTKEAELFGAHQAKEGKNNLAGLIKVGAVKRENTAWCWDKTLDPHNKKLRNRQLGLSIKVMGKNHVFNMRNEVDRARLDVLLAELKLQHLEEKQKARLIEEKNRRSFNSALEKKAMAGDTNF